MKINEKTFDIALLMGAFISVIIAVISAVVIRLTAARVSVIRFIEIVVFHISSFIVCS